MSGSIRRRRRSLPSPGTDAAAAQQRKRQSDLRSPDPYRCHAFYTCFIFHGAPNEFIIFLELLTAPRRGPPPRRRARAKRPPGRSRRRDAALRPQAEGRPRTFRDGYFRSDVPFRSIVKCTVSTLRVARRISCRTAPHATPSPSTSASVSLRIPAVSPELIAALSPFFFILFLPFFVSIFDSSVPRDLAQSLVPEVISAAFGSVRGSEGNMMQITK